MNPLRALLALRGHGSARAALWVLGGQVANLFFQAAYFLLLARLLGVESYGIFAGAFALVNLLTPYSALGSAMLFMRYVSVDRAQARVFWGNMLLTILVVSSLLGAVLVLIAPRTIGPGRGLLVLSLVLSNCVMAQVVACASSVFLTLGQARDAAANRFLANMLRTVLLVGMLATLHRATATQWAYGFLLASAVAAGAAYFWVHRAIGAPHFSLAHLRLHLREGLGFSLAASTESVYNDMDKVFLSHYGMNAAAGIYTLAYRVADVASAPVGSILSVMVPRWFALHAAGAGRVRAAAPRLLRVCVLVSLCAAASVLVGSPLVARLVGHGFAESVVAMRWLCWLPVLRSIHLVAGDVLMCTGKQPIRTVAQVLTGAINIALNMWLIPRHGWLGAAWASLASDGCLAIFNLLLIAVYAPAPRAVEAA